MSYLTQLKILDDINGTADLANRGESAPYPAHQRLSISPHLQIPTAAKQGASKRVSEMAIATTMSTVSKMSSTVARTRTTRGARLAPSTAMVMVPGPAPRGIIGTPFRAPRAQQIPGRVDHAIAARADTGT